MLSFLVLAETKREIYSKQSSEANAGFDKQKSEKTKGFIKNDSYSDLFKQIKETKNKGSKKILFDSFVGLKFDKSDIAEGKHLEVSKISFFTKTNIRIFVYCSTVPKSFKEKTFVASIPADGIFEFGFPEGVRGDIYYVAVPSINVTINTHMILPSEFIRSKNKIAFHPSLFESKYSIQTISERATKCLCSKESGEVSEFQMSKIETREETCKTILCQDYNYLKITPLELTDKFSYDYLLHPFLYSFETLIENSTIHYSEQFESNLIIQGNFSSNMYNMNILNLDGYSIDTESITSHKCDVYAYDMFEKAEEFGLDAVESDKNYCIFGYTNNNEKIPIKIETGKEGSINAEVITGFDPSQPSKLKKRVMKEKETYEGENEFVFIVVYNSKASEKAITVNGLKPFSSSHLLPFFAEPTNREMRLKNIKNWYIGTITFFVLFIPLFLLHFSSPLHENIDDKYFKKDDEESSTTDISLLLGSRSDKDDYSNSNHTNDVEKSINKNSDEYSLESLTDKKKLNVEEVKLNAEEVKLKSEENKEEKNSNAEKDEKDLIILSSDYSCEEEIIFMNGGNSSDYEDDI